MNDSGFAESFRLAFLLVELQKEHIAAGAPTRAGVPYMLIGRDVRGSNTSKEGVVALQRRKIVLGM